LFHFAEICYGVFDHVTTFTVAGSKVKITALPLALNMQCGPNYSRHLLQIHLISNQHARYYFCKFTAH